MRPRFVVRAPIGIAVVCGAALSQALAQDMPKARLQFLAESHNDPAAVREGRVDLDVGVSRIRDPETEWVDLSHKKMVGAARAAHALLSQTVAPERLAAVRHVAVAPRPGDSSPVDAALAALGLERWVALVVPSAFTALIAASRSVLVACVPERVARAMAPSLQLDLFALPLSVESSPTRMAWHPRYSADPAHRWLRDSLVRVLEGPMFKGSSVSVSTRRSKGHRTNTVVPGVGPEA